jgi:hypothetical protein
MVYINLRLFVVILSLLGYFFLDYITQILTRDMDLVLLVE